MSGFDALLERIASLEHRLANLNPVGTVHERDKDKGVRIRLGGTDEKPFLSDWTQPGDWSGVGRYLPDVGEQAMLLTYGGDLRQATVLPLTHSDDKKNPATDADETVIYEKGGIRIAALKGKLTIKNGKTVMTLDGDGVTHTVDGVTQKITKAGIDAKGGKLTHDDKNIGSSHTHGGVNAGSGKTAGPEA